MKVGILGGGQLGRMLALAGRRLGMTFRFLEPSPDPPVAGLGEVIQADYDDREALEGFARGLDVVTYEFENVPVDAARWLSDRVPVHPDPAALEVAQDRSVEKRTFEQMGIPTAPFRDVAVARQLAQAVNELGLPLVLKTRRLGYDGKGQAVIRSTADLDEAWKSVDGVRCIAEAFVPFERELSVVAARSRDGQMAFYPLVENEHREGILRRTVAPAPDVAPELQEQAHAAVRRIAEGTRYCGVLALELFQVGDKLLANEMAPRVHNSGHWSQDGAVTCQFENHLRAVVGLPLGSTALVAPRTVMTNLIGSSDPLEELLVDPRARVHLYEKAPRPGRKIGHVNVVHGVAS